MRLFRTVELRPMIDSVEPPQWWVQLWADHTEAMSFIGLTIIGVLVLFLATFHTVV